MELYIGGCGQGKLTYVLQAHQGEHWEVVDGGSVSQPVSGTEIKNKIILNKVILNHLHLWVRNLMEEGQDPEQQVEALIKRCPGCIFISDEVGNGIVPAGQQEREYRERLGRIQTGLAARAERVERVICGIGQRLK